MPNTSVARLYMPVSTTIYLPTLGNLKFNSVVPVSQKTQRAHKKSQPTDAVC